MLRGSPRAPPHGGRPRPRRRAAQVTSAAREFKSSARTRAGSRGEPSHPIVDDDLQMHYLRCNGQQTGMTRDGTGEGGAMRGRDRRRFRRVPDRHAHQRFWKPHKWLPVATAMPRMLAELARAPDLGLLHARLQVRISEPHGGAVLAQLRSSPSLRDRSRSRTPAGVEGVQPGRRQQRRRRHLARDLSRPRRRATRTSTTTCRRSDSGLPVGWCQRKDARRRRREGSIWQAMSVRNSA